MTKFRTTTAVCAWIGAITIASSASLAQDQIGPVTPQGQAEEPEIVVTAQRRAERSSDVPISVTSLNAEQLGIANVTQLSDTVKLTPGLRFDSQGAATQPTIRGVGTAITTSGGGPNVGIYVDGFFQSNPYVADFQLTKVSSIQVLKGPQGTLFGRNTTGGAILVTTDDPSTDDAMQFSLRYGRFDTIRTQAYVTLGLTDRIAFDVEAAYNYGNGFQTNILSGDDHIGQYRSWSVRSGLKIDVTDDVSILLRYTHADAADPTPQLVNAFVDKDGSANFFSKVSAAGQAVYGRSSSAGQALIYLYAPAGTFATQPGQIALNDPVSFHNRSDIIQGTIKADIGIADLISYTQYRHDDTPYFGDLDATALPFFQINVPVINKTFSQEFVLTSKPGSPLQWTAGLNYNQTRDTWDVNAAFGGTPFGDFGGSSTMTKSYAAFADLTYEFGDRFFITLGGRYSRDIVTDAYFKTNFTTVAYEGSNGQSIPSTVAPETKIFAEDLKNDSLTPRLVLRYKPSADSSIYGSYTRGYKAGILNVGGLSLQPVSPEEINAFELGYKFDNRTFAIDLATFYYDYKNLQVSSYQNGAAQIRNAASSEIYGVEGQIRYSVTPAFNVNLGAAWTHARYKSFVNAPFYTYCDPTAAVGTATGCVPIALGGFGPGALIQTTTDASGMQMQRAPEFTATLGASYSLAVSGGRLMLSGNLYYSSDFYFDPSEQFRQDAYETLSLRAEWTDSSDHFSLAVYGDNVTGRRYRTQVLFNTLGTGSVWNMPATYGMSMTVKF